MKRVSLTLVFCLIFVVALSALAYAASAAPAFIAPAQITWQPGGTNLPAGSKMAVIAGDPSKSGFYTIRVSIPAGAVVTPAHWHTMTEYITVLEGTFVVGTGDVIDKTKANAMPAGSFIIMPAGIHHWAMAQGATTVIEVSGEGPVTWSTAKSSGM